MVDITARISQSKVIATKVHIVDAVGLDGLTNVTLTSPADGSYIIFRSSDNQFINDNTIVKTSTGITLTGELAATSLDISGNADIDGVLETDSLTINTDQASIADTGIITSKGLIIDAGEVNIKDAADINGATTRLTVGTGDDLLLYHFNNDSYIKEVGTGSLIIQSNNVVLKNHLGSQLLSTDLDSAQLFYATNGSNPVGKLETAVNGVSIFGSLILDDGVLGNTGNTTTLVENAASDIVLTLPSTTGTIALSGANVATTQLTGTVTNAQLANNTVSYGGISLALGATDATPAFNLQDATGYPTSSLVGTITNAQLAGSIANAKLANSTITVSDGSNTSPVALGGTLTFAATSNEVTVVESAGTVTIGLPDDVTIAGDLTVSTAPTSGGHVTNKTYVDAQVAGVVDSAPAALNTLNELAAALGDDASFATTTATTIGEKLAKASNLSDLANVGTARTNLGLGTAATTDSSAYATAAQGTTADNALQPAGTLTGAIQTTSITNTMTGLTMNAGGTTTGASIVFREGTNTGTNAIKLQAPAQVDGAGGFGTLDITFPNAAGTMALTSDLSSFITASSSDTLTNKSIAATQLTGTIDDARIPSGIARDSELSSFITASSSDTLTNKSIAATQLTGTIDNARLPAAATNITSVGTLTGLTTGATTVNGDIVLNGTDAGSTAPNLDFYHLSASPAVSDRAGTINFFADNASNEKIIYGKIEARSQSITNGQEEGLIVISPRVSHGGADLTSTSPVLTVKSISGTQVGEVKVLNNLVVSSGTAGGTFAGGPTLTLSREELYEGVDNDEFGVISFKAFNDRGLSSGGPESIEYAHMHAKILDASDGTEDGQLEFGTIANGSLVEPLMTMNSSELSVNTPLTVNATTQSLSDTTTNSNSTYGPNIEVYRDGGAATSSGTAFSQQNKLGAIDFFGNNDAGTPEKIKYAKVFGSIKTKTDGSEDGRLSFSVMTAGTHTEGANPASILDLEPDVAVFKQDVRIQASATGNVNATPTPILELYQEDGPQADDGDHLGEIQFTALNDNGFSPIKHKYAGIHAEIIDESNATEDGSLHFTCCYSRDRRYYGINT